MANTLLSIAKADIKTAKSLVNSDDKYQKHQAAYMTQQGVEKTLKYVISLKTGGQPWGHDIDKLVKIAQSNGVDVPDHICKMANKITTWEVVSRYYPTSVIRRDTISHVIRVADEWQMKLK
jgi:HEPN domain-containing protein